MSSCSRALGGWLAGCGAATALICAFPLVVMAITRGGNLAQFVGDVVLLLVLALVIFVVTCVLTAIPSVLVIWLSEALQIRSALFFGSAGAAVGAVSQTLLFRTFTLFGLLCVLSGYTAGLSYWYVAGRFAGRERRFA